MKNKKTFAAGMVAGAAIIVVIGLIAAGVANAASSSRDSRSDFDPYDVSVEKLPLEEDLDLTIPGDTKDRTEACNLRASVMAWITPRRVDVATWTTGGAKCETEVFVDRGRGLKKWGVAKGDHIILGKGSVKQVAVRLCSVGGRKITDVNCSGYLLTTRA